MSLTLWYASLRETSHADAVFGILIRSAFRVRLPLDHIP
jgi:hypothetical protein